MKKNALLSLGLGAAWLCGCGSSDVNSVSYSNNSASIAKQITVSGRILSESGSPQAGVRIIANERTTDAKVETTSGPDGSFQAILPEGVYDVGLDRPGDKQTATCFYGPFPVVQEVHQDLVLRQSNGQPAGHVSGKLWLQPGIPASKRKVNLRSAHLGGSTTLTSVSITTAADGTFGQVLGSEQELGLDLEVFDAQGNLDEFIDIGKLSKPVYVEFFTELPVTANRLRSDETDPPAQPSIRAKAGDFALFDQLESKPVTGNPNMLVFTKGLLPVDNIDRTFFDGIMSNPVALQFNAYRGYTASGKIKVAKNGSWWWTYAVNIDPDSPSYWEFEDETTDLYSLHVFTSLYSHKVSYNSDKPAIQGIATVDPTSTPPSNQ